MFKNPIFFIQCIFPILILMISTIIIVLMALPNIQAILMSELFEEGIEFSVDLSIICLILALIQIIFTMSNIFL